ncbi:DNA repair protein RecO [Microaerobacter geothermalis]|uniref:DNA repair protein RecO n=1 Tax=Microaerobacter geothermalis TaxID=674972 RepID=UPI001F298D3E|nr:DNA repair protein RecO [Microaerobacter geothermalis]MCF6092818.1 DNA repair protein RecO [Microaerobacter geothermalis]
MLSKAEGIVIRSVDYGEGNKIITLYTREWGKIGAMARGAKKTKSRLSSVSQVLTHGIYLLHTGSQLGNISQGEIISSFQEIRQDLTKTSYALYYFELMDRLTEERERNTDLFELLLTTLQYLSAGKDEEILTRIFEVKILQASGYQPRLERCMKCQGNDLPMFFSITEGGILCMACSRLDKDAVSLLPGTLKLLRLFQTIDVKRLGNISVSPQTKGQLDQVLRRFMETHTGLQLKSRRFLDQLDRLR